MPNHPHRTAAPAGPARIAGRLLILGVLAMPLLGMTGCAGTAEPTGSTAAPVDAAEDAAGGPGANTVPECPFTEAEVSRLVEQPMTAEGNCLFGDGNGVASLNVTMASRIAGLGTLDYSRQRAEQRFDRVVDLDGGGYLAAGALSAEAVLVGDGGSYTLLMSSFERLDAAGYEQTLRALAASIAD